MLLKPSTVSFDEGPDFPCYLSPNTWNGWAMPYFTKEQADKVTEWTNSRGSGEVMKYDAEKDAFTVSGIIWSDDPDEEPEVWEAIEHEGQKLYGIGAGSWTWNYPWEDEKGNSTDPWEGNFVAGAWRMLRGFMQTLWRPPHNSDNCPALKAVFAAEGQEEDEGKLRTVIKDALAAADNLNLPVRADLRKHAEAVSRGENPFAK